MGRQDQLEAYKDKLAAAGSLQRRESASGVSFGVGGEGNLAATLKTITRAIKRFEQGLAYTECPPELCAGEELDLRVWSLVVTDGTLREVARRSAETLDAARRYEEAQVAFRGRGKRKKESDAGARALGLLLSSTSSPTLGYGGGPPSARSGASSRRRRRPGSAGAAAAAALSARGGEGEGGGEGAAAPEEVLAATAWAAGSPGLLALRANGASQVTDAGLAPLARSAPRLELLELRGALAVGDAGARALACCCPGLRELDLGGAMGLRGDGLGALGDCCPKLERVGLAGCRNAAPWALAHLFRGAPALRVLDLSHCPQVGDPELKSLAEYCPEMRELGLRECPQVSDVGLLGLSHGCPRLAALDVARSEMRFRVTDVGLLALGERCPALHTLKAAGCDTITDVGLQWLAKGCAALTHLDVAGCPKIGNAGVGALCEGCPDLQYLDVTGNKRIGDTALRYLGERCPRLHTLRAGGLFLISDGKKRAFGLEGVQALAGGCAELTDVDFSGVFQISTNALRALAGQTRFRRLALARCPRLTAKGLAAALDDCAGLTELSLAGCGDEVTNKLLRAVGERCRQLEKVNLSGCEAFGDRGLRALLRPNPRVHTLDLSGCAGVRDASMLVLGEAGFEPGLAAVHLVGCPGVTDTGLSWLVDGCPTLHLLALKGTQVHLTALQSVRDMFVYSELKNNNSFFGLWPLRRVKDRMHIDEYGQQVRVATKLQAMFRARRTRRATEHVRREHYRRYLNAQLNALWRRKKGRGFLDELRAEIAAAHRAATIVQGLYRIRRARRLLAYLRREAWLRRAHQAAREVQRAYRGLGGRRRAARRREELRQLALLRQRMAGEIQRVARGRLGRNRFRALWAAREAELARQKACVIRIQKHTRAQQARRRAQRIRQENERQLMAMTLSAILIQQLFRSARARAELDKRRRRHAALERGAVLLQTRWRGIRTRTRYHEMVLLRGDLREQAAAARLQAVWRARLARAAARAAAVLAKQIRAEQDAAAAAVQRWYRGALAKRQAVALKLEHLAELRRMAQLEIDAATTIAAAWRGKKGRDRARARLAERMTRWKKMWDEEKGAAFYYNQVSGEIRWRAPQDVLEMMPRPRCGNCARFEAFLECAGCSEYYCSACWETVHYGGRRKRHRFRVLYDHYHHRVDYGDGEFPSRWPAEIEQDDTDGWRLRLDEHRDPAEERGDWQRYHDEESGRDFYYNTATEESTYEVPPGFTATPDASVPKLVEWTEHFDETTNMSYFYNAETGESTYDKPDNAMIVRQESSATHDTSGGWTQHFDEEYGVAYYHHAATGESTYDPPPGFNA